MLMETYWNHNTAFHDELIADVKRRGGRVLDIGCGDGLLVQRIAPFCQYVLGIDLDQDATARAQIRLANLANVSLETVDFLDMPIPSLEERFSTIICVATLHHMDLQSALLKMRNILIPGGRILIIGLAANKSFADYAFSGLYVIPVRIMEQLHRGFSDSRVRTAHPKESLKEIIDVANTILPGVKIRRRFYYRYSLCWDNAD